MSNPPQDLPPRGWQRLNGAKAGSCQVYPFLNIPQWILAVLCGREKCNKIEWKIRTSNFGYEDIIHFSPSEMDYPIGLNLFEFDNPDQKDFLIQEAINMLYKLYDPQRQGIIGPRYEHWFRNAALTLMADPAGSTFIDIPKVFTDNAYMKQKLKFVEDITVRDFWEKEMAKTSDYHKSEVMGWFVSKFGAFMSNEMMRNIIGQTKS